MVTDTKPDVSKTSVSTAVADRLLERDLPRQDAGPKSTDRPGGTKGGMAPVELASPPVSGLSTEEESPRDTKESPSKQRVTPIATGIRPQSRPESVRNLARLFGRTLRFPAGIPLRPGHPVEAAGQVFEIQPEQYFKGVFAAKAAGVLVLAVLAVIGIVSIFTGGGGQPALMGVVINAETGQIIPNAVVSMTDGGTVRTNEAGLYVFRSVPPGQHVLTAGAVGFTEQNGIVRCEDGGPVELSFAIAPVPYAAATAGQRDTFATAVGNDPDQSGPGKSPASSGASGYGSIDLKVDFSDYIVFVDGELYGKNPDKIKRLPEGEHRILLQVDGYHDYSANMAIKARVTSTLTVAKADLVPKVDPVKRSRGHFAEGKNYLDKQEWGAAIFELNKALADVPEYAEALQYRGWAYLKSGNPVEARRDFLQAAQHYDAAKRYIDAIACMRYLIDMEPKNASFWRQRADYNLALADYANAISDYEQAVKIDKKDAGNLMALGEAHFAKGDFREAAKQFDRARRVADDPTKAYIRMILAHYHAGENNDVVKKYRDFSQIAPPDLMTRLRNDPEWLRVLQIVGPDERTKN